MARCPPANQHTAKTRTTQDNDRRASKWVIVTGNDLVWRSAKQTPQPRSNRSGEMCDINLVTDDSRLTVGWLNRRLEIMGL